MRTYCGCDDKKHLNLGTEIRPVIRNGGAESYDELSNKQSINGVKLVGDKTNEELLIVTI